VTTRAVLISNTLGLHARAAARFVRLAGTFAAQIRVDRAGRTIDGKSIMALSALVERGFDEEPACSS
jgi:phosphocarrier protein